MNLRNKAIQISNIPKKKNANQSSTSNSHNTVDEKENDDKEKSLDEVVRKENPKENVTKELTRKEVLNKYMSEENNSFEDAGKKHFVVQRELVLPEKFSSTSSFETKIAKVKISLPFSDNLKNFEYISHIRMMLKAKDFPDTVNLQDYTPNIMFGPKWNSSNLEKWKVH